MAIFPKQQIVDLLLFGNKAALDPCGVQVLELKVEIAPTIDRG